MIHKRKNQTRKYLHWRVKNLYLHDVIRVEEYATSKQQTTISYVARVIDVTAFAGVWRVLLRNGAQVHSFLIDTDTSEECLVSRIDIIKEGEA